jgi:hypothetical protein
MNHLNVMWNCSIAINIYSVCHSLTSCQFECLLTAVNCVVRIKFLILISNMLCFTFKFTYISLFQALCVGFKGVKYF